MKKILALTLCILVFLCSCGKSSTPDTNPIQNTTGSSTTQDSTSISQQDTLNTASKTNDAASTSSHTTASGTTGSTKNQNNSAGSTTRPSQQTQTVTTIYLPGKSTKPTTSSCQHKDEDNNGLCDHCKISVVVVFDIYSINDLHGKFADTNDNTGVDELTTYLKNARKENKNTILLSAGDTWQGSSESNMTKGELLTEWMNELDFAGMALGNHEFDWGEEFIAANAEKAEFPLLAINVYDRDSNTLSPFCTPSVMIDSNGVQIGVIGAIGDSYSSIAVDKCDEVYFKVGYELTQLVKAESERLQEAGADFIVYVLHDGYGQSQSGQISRSQLATYYDVSLSDGYVDLVFEGHTHQGYRLQDEHGVFHLQNRGDNKGGISHAKVSINTANNTSNVGIAELVSLNTYQNLSDDPIVEDLLDKFKDQISEANRVLGYNSRFRSSDELQETIAKLYYEAAADRWGKEYDIVLGGGFMSARSPYNLYAGDVTYAQLQSIFPFDNQLTLCSVKGRFLRSKFLETTNDRYFIYCSEYGSSIRNQIDPNGTYYLITDSYSAYYAPNNLTVIETYDDDVFARDLLAKYIEEGGFE